MIGEDPERAYIASLAADGLTHTQIAADLVSLGWHPQSAATALARFAAKVPNESASVGPDLSEVPLTIDLGDRQAKLLMFTRTPAACLFGDFLSQAECEELISIAQPNMRRSRVIASDEVDDEEGALAYARTSDQTSFSRGESELVDLICGRVSLATRWPVDQMEGMQVVRYGPGAEFSPHHDYFCPNSRPDLIARTGQRVATILLYLNAPTSGGSTCFPDVELEVLPHQGNALFFSYARAHPDSLTLHAGVPVAAGEKWIATIFLRDKVVAHASRASSQKEAH